MKLDSPNVFICPENEVFKNENKHTIYVTNLLKKIVKKIKMKKMEDQKILKRRKKTKKRKRLKKPKITRKGIKVALMAKTKNIFVTIIRNVKD